MATEIRSCNWYWNWNCKETKYWKRKLHKHLNARFLNC